MLEGNRIDLGYKFYSMTTSSNNRILIGDLIIPIARSIVVNPNPHDKMFIYKGFRLVVFEQMKFYKVKGGQIS